jgi:hypothetical protein
MARILKRKLEYRDPVGKQAWHMSGYEIVDEIGRKRALRGYGQLFCSIPLFEDLAKKGIYATGSVRSNCIRLPSHLRNTRAWKRCEQGSIEWAMHDSRLMSCVIWKDKCPDLFISTHANPIGFPCVPWDEVPRRNGAIREAIPMSPMLLEYTTFMRDVDVIDQL